MSLEYVSVENSKYHREYCPPGLDKSTASLTYPPPLRQAEADEPRVANPEIDRILQRLSDKGLCGEAHVTQYLLYLHRRNCRRNTIRSNGSTIILFLTFLTSIGRNHLENITREDFSAFIEREQDRGLKPRDRAMLVALLRTGMRIGELLDSRVENVNIREERIEIFEAQKN